MSDPIDDFPLFQPTNTPVPKLDRRTLGNHRTHNMYGTPEHRSWRAMYRRCYEERTQQYPYYGERGVRVCERWRGKEGCANFIADMGLKPSPKHTIDRKNNSGHYSCGKCEECREKSWPSNCRWLTNAEQQRNRRSNVLIEFRGETKCLQAWADEMGLVASSIMGRLKRGWTVERALTTPPGPGGRGSIPGTPTDYTGSRYTVRITVNGVTRPLAEWVILSGIPRPVIEKRIHQLGWTPERAISTPRRAKRPNGSALD